MIPDCAHVKRLRRVDPAVCQFSKHSEHWLQMQRVLQKGLLHTLLKLAAHFFPSQACRSGSAIFKLQATMQ